MMMFGGVRMESCESMCTGSTIVMASRRESVLRSTSSLVPRDVPEKHLMTVSLARFETTVGM